MKIKMYLKQTEHVEPMDIAIMSNCHMRLEIGYQSIWVTWLNKHGKKIRERVILQK